MDHGTGSPAITMPPGITCTADDGDGAMGAAVASWWISTASAANRAMTTARVQRAAPRGARVREERAACTAITSLTGAFVERIARSIYTPEG